MRVLIADDSKAMRMIVLRTLRQTGMTVGEVFEADDGAVALEAVAGFAPDIIFSDWNMPNKSGIEFLRELRATGNQTPFGFVTSESNPAMREQAIEAGAQFLLCKPFNADQFEEIVGSVVH